MARKKAKALPPNMITVYGEILQETEKAILVRCDEDADGVWLPKSQIKYSGERGDTGVEIEIPELMADEKGFFDGMGRPEVEVAPAPEEPEGITLAGSVIEFFPDNDEVEVDFIGIRVRLDFSEYTSEPNIFDVGDEVLFTMPLDVAVAKGLEEPPSEKPDNTPAGKRAFGDNVKWLKEEIITVLTPLSESEKARYAEEMAALDKEIEELEDERAAVSSRLKKQIDAKEQERREMSAHVNDGESRTFSCDCLKDYNTGEMVWTNAYPPYVEVQRRKMTQEEMQPTLLEYSEKLAAGAAAPEGQDFDTLGDVDAPGEAEPGEDDADHDPVIPPAEQGQGAEAMQ